MNLSKSELLKMIEVEIIKGDLVEERWQSPISKMDCITSKSLMKDNSWSFVFVKAGFNSWIIKKLSSGFHYVVDDKDVYQEILENLKSNI